jgi:CRISPR-associated protein Cas2
MKLLVAYDIADDKLRTRFSKFLSKFGRRIQYSLFELKNSERILNLVSLEIKAKYANKFTQSDSVIIFKMSTSCEQISFGYAKNDETDLIIL